jgi:hypothetical protein
MGSPAYLSIPAPAVRRIEERGDGAIVVLGSGVLVRPAPAC